jgi:hypothetical protein
MISEYLYVNQISTKKSPFWPDYQKDVLVCFMVTQGKTPRKPTDEECDGVPMSEELWSLAQDCWEIEAEQRPTIDSVLGRL